MPFLENIGATSTAWLPDNHAPNSLLKKGEPSVWRRHLAGEKHGLQARATHFSTGF